MQTTFRIYVQKYKKDWKSHFDLTFQKKAI